MSSEFHVGGGYLYSEVQWIMGNGHIGTTPLMGRMTDTTENITFPQLRWGTVNMQGPL